MNDTSRPKNLHHIVIGRLSEANIPTTLASAISQLSDPDTTVLVTVVIERSASRFDAGSDAVHFVEVSSDASIAARENLAAYSQPAATTIRFLDDGEVLAPSATVDDIRALRAASWCASGVADADGTVIHRRTSGSIPIHSVLNEWAAPTVALSVHSSGVAYSYAVFVALGGFSAVDYAHRTELMARAGESWPGHYRAGAASLTLRPHTDALRERPPSFGRDRVVITAALLAGRAAPERKCAQEPIEQWWDEISVTAWATYTDGLATEISDTDTLYEVMMQARKLHYRFAWPQLVDYIDSAGTRFRGVDDYLELMYLTAAAAHTQRWDEAIAFADNRRQYRIIHLLLTAMFESSASDPKVIKAGVEYAEALLIIAPADPVAHYRLMSFHRMLGEYEIADQWRRRTLDVIAVLPDRDLSNHLRERVLAEGPIIVSHLRPGPLRVATR